jgi:histidinol-phosphate aminotransferase
MSRLVALRPGLRHLTGYHSPQVEVQVRLNTNESPLPPPDAWVDEVREEIGKIAFHRYPDREAVALRAALAAHHGVSVEHVFCANGSNEVLQCLLLAYGGAQRNVALFEPTYSLHRHIASLTSTDVVSGPRQSDYRLDLDVVDDVLRTADPVITFLCSPNNPTGRAEPAEVVSHVLEAAPGLVVVDEAYGQFAPWSALDLLAEALPAAARLVVVRTFSKTWSMAASRLGYLIADPEIVSACQLVALPYHLDALTQVSGRLALHYVDAMEDRVALLMRERDRLAATLAGLPVQTWPSDANFLLFRPLELPAREVWEGLLEQSVLIRDCSTWPGLDQCLRVTIGNPEENDRFLAALAATVNGKAS